MAEAPGLPVIPHSNEAHNLHIIFSRPSHLCPLVEYFPDVEPDTGNELFWKLVAGLPVAVDGGLTMHRNPGLGIELRENVVADLCVG
jgi:L-alanine-DL-glutamate epimerase-like enolase superfamily enzyme